MWQLEMHKHIVCHNNQWPMAAALDVMPAIPLLYAGSVLLKCMVGGLCTLQQHVYRSSSAH